MAFGLLQINQGISYPCLPRIPQCAGIFRLRIKLRFSGTPMSNLIYIVTALFTGLLAGSVSGQGDAAAGQAKSALCATRHGADGYSAMR